MGRLGCVGIVCLATTLISSGSATYASVGDHSLLLTCMRFADEIDVTRDLIKSGSYSNDWNLVPLRAVAGELSFNFKILLISAGPVVSRRISGNEAGFEPFQGYMSKVEACLVEDAHCGAEVADTLWHELDTRIRTACRQDFKGEW